MDDHNILHANDDTTYWGQHRLMLLVAMSILVALVLVGISMALYASSGAAQLDLSRPGYRDVSSQAVNENGNAKTFSATGDITTESLSEFNSLYETQSTKATAVDAFSGDPLSPDALELSAPVAE
jgi:hypothetical protein